MKCRDPFVNYLKGAGYNAVRLPRENLSPNHILEVSRRKLSRLGEISTIMQPAENQALPAVTENQRFGDIQGMQTGNIDIGLGLSLINSVIGAMGGSKLGLDGKYAGARNIVFSFSDVLEDSIERAALDQYLSVSTVNENAVDMKRLLHADQIAVITATLKSKTLTVEARKENDRAIELDVPEIAELVGGSVNVSGTGTVSTKLTYEGSVPLVFGVQAIRLEFDDGRYRRLRRVSSNATLEGLAMPESTEETYLFDSDFSEIR